MEISVCDACGKDVERRKLGPHKSAHVRSAKAKYRYFDHQRKHPHEWKACENCGKEGWIAKRHRFCSYRCSKWETNNPQWKGDAAKPTTARVRAHKRFVPDFCAECRTTENLHRHHRDGDTYNNTPENIQFLCASCHSSLHHALAR